MGAFCPVAVSAQNLEIIISGMSTLAPGGNMIAVAFFILDSFAAPHTLLTLLPMLSPLIPFRENPDTQTSLTPTQHILVDSPLVGDILVNFQLSDASLQSGGVIAVFPILIEQDAPRDSLHQLLAVVREGGAYPIDDRTEVRPEFQGCSVMLMGRHVVRHLNPIPVTEPFEGSFQVTRTI